jgi:hypothetical protein
MEQMNVGGPPLRDIASILIPGEEVVCSYALPKVGCW